MTDFDDLFEHVATIRRRTLVADNFGFRGAATWSDLATGVKGSLQALGQGERLAGDAVLETGTHQWFMDSSQNLKGRDLLVVGTTTYEVLGPAGDHSKLSLGIARYVVRHRERD